MDCPAELCLARRVQRDVLERGRSPVSVREQFRRTVAPMHRRYVAPQVAWADIVLRQPLGQTDVLKLADRLWTLMDANGACQWNHHDGKLTSLSPSACPDSIGDGERVGVRGAGATRGEKELIPGNVAAFNA